MATITSRPLVDRLIAGNGCFQDDPPVDAIIEYHTTTGETCWKIVYHADCLEDTARVVAETLLSPYVVNPKVIWTRRIKE